MLCIKRAHLDPVRLIVFGALYWAALQPIHRHAVVHQESERSDSRHQQEDSAPAGAPHKMPEKMYQRNMQSGQRMQVTVPLTQVQEAPWTPVIGPEGV